MRTSARLGIAAAVAVGVSLSLATPALADYGPAPLDVVGAGSDTVQNIMNFAADGKGATPGFNTSGNKYKLVSLDATGDANDRTVYGRSSTTPLKLTVEYRAGKSPQQRANGTGSGYAALLQDTAVGSAETINWIRGSRLPNAGEITTASGISGWGGGLHVIKIATDDLLMAAATTTNAVPLTGAQLVDVYTCTTTNWSTFGGTAGTIVPFIPQSGSGTGDTFRTDLAAANGGVAPTIGGCVQTSEENDPAAIAGNPNAIEPMSSGRKALFDSGFFHDPTVAFPTATSISSGVQLLYGSGGTAQTPNACIKPTNPAGTGNTLTYCNTRGLYVAWRESDNTFATPWQPGGTRNWVQTLFWRAVGDGTPYVKTLGGQAAIAAGGVTATWVDCGLNPTSC
jgi:ABC-type phosphate transport system substrate-binding protein